MGFNIGGKGRPSCKHNAKAEECFLEGSTQRAPRFNARVLSSTSITSPPGGFAFEKASCRSK